MPYDNKFSLFYNRIYENFKTNLKYTRRVSYDKVVGISESKPWRKWKEFWRIYNDEKAIQISFCFFKY